MSATLHRAALTIATLIGIAAVLSMAGAPAEAGTPGKVTVSQAMIPVPTNTTTVAAYMTIHNGTGHAVSIVGASTPASIAGMAMPMKEVLHGQSETMVNVPRITIASQKTFTLAPGNYHIMLMQLKAHLVKGNKVPLTLQLSNGTSVSVTATVVPLSVAFGKGGTAPSSGTGSSDSDMGGMKGMKGMG